MARAEWMEASSDHFVIYSDDSQANIRNFADQLERFHAALALVLDTKLAKPSPSNRVTVFVVASEGAVQRLYGPDSRYIGGFYLPRAGNPVAFVPRVKAARGEVDSSMETLLHEYTHHFLISNSDFTMPRWMSEGAAEFFASAAFPKTGGVDLGRPANLRAPELFLARNVSVIDLLDQARYEKHKTSEYDNYYGKAWLLYHFMFFTPERSGQMSKYANLLAKGKAPVDAGTEAFGDLGKLQRELDAYMRQRLMHSLALPADKLVVGPIAVRKLSEGEAAAIPYIVRSRRGVDDAGAKDVVAKMSAVAARYPGDPAVLAELAEAQFDAGDDGAAIKAADAALAVDKARVNAYVEKGYALFRQAAKADGDRAKAYAAARAPFVALNRIENDHPLPLIYYYRSFVEQGLAPPKIAIDGIEYALALAPYDDDLRVEVGLMEIRQGKHDDARVTLQPIASSPHGGTLALEVQKIIARLDAEPGWKGDGYELPNGLATGDD